jgi:DNA gyrase subunit B
MVEKFVDDKIDWKEDDIEKIQTKPNMYISYLGSRGVLHLSKEVINNMIDECINPNSPGNDIDIILDEVENTLTVSDNGRGIPFEKMEVVCTKLQAGSKFTREGSGGSAGENGVGLTAVNALSDYFEISVRRYGEKASIKFARGKMTQQVKAKKDSKTDAHGTTTIFKPSSYFMGDDCQISSEGLLEWMEKIIYLVPPDIRINFQAIRKGKESNINKKFKNKNGLLDYVKKLTKKPILDPIFFMESMKLKEYLKGKELDRFMGLEVAFTFNSSPGDMIVDSFCNFVNTVDNGVHVDAVRQGITQYLSKHTRESLSERDAKRLDIIPNDVTSGLVLTVNVSTNMNPQFSGQTKEKVGSSELFKPLRDMTYRAMNDHFRKNPKELKKLTDYIKTNAKARIEATKVRNSVVKGNTTSLDEHKIKGFTPALARGRNDYRELLLVEGESAVGSLNQDKFNQFQATYGLRGVPLNTFGLKLDKVLTNNEFRDLVKLLKTNIGEKFDITKLWYKKIIIMTDSDVDGFRISSLICVFFLIHMPEIVEQGHLYKAVAPLYEIKDSKKPFILSKEEFIEVFERRIGDNIKLINIDDSSVVKSKVLKEFLFINRDYLEELHRIANHFGIHRQIIEFVAIHSDTKNFGKRLTKRFPEISLDKDNILSGIYEGRFQVLSLDKQFFKRIESLKKYIHTFNEGKAYYRVHEKNSKGYEDKGVMSIGDFMTLCQKFQPEILTRFKGLGELNPEDLKKTTLDPNNRTLIQLTIKDLEEELRKFRVLHGDSSDERKDLMAHFKISRDQLDN